MSIVVLACSAAYAALAFTAWRPLPQRGRGAPWLPALAVGETAPQQIAAGACLAVVAMSAGWARGVPGFVSLSLIAVALVLLTVVHVRALRAGAVLAAAVEEATGHPVHWSKMRLGDLLRPRAPYPAHILRRTFTYGDDPAQRLVRLEAPGRAKPSPVFCYVHGGGWTGGAPGRQARPLLRHLAERGWVVFDVGYRLSPRATYPDHLHDVLRAVAWVRATAPDHGVDARFIAIGGGSAGGHLAAMAALSGDAHGFHDVGVQACVPLYGVHDLLDDTGRPKWPYLAKHVLKVGVADDPVSWRAASPVHGASPHRPVFLVLHGALDTLVRPEESRRLVTALRAAGGPPVGHAELPGATHGFDSVASVRGLRTAQAIASALETLYSGHLTREGEER
jgi:acetyl esterase/lipase